MKKIINSMFLAVAVMALLTGCSDDKDNKAEIRVVSAQTEYYAEGGGGQIVVEAAGDVIATSQFTWCKVTPNGNTVNISVDPNPDLETRHSEVTLESRGQTTSVVVSQLGIVAAELVFSENVNKVASDVYSVTILEEGGEFGLEMSTDLSYSIVCDPADHILYTVDGDNIEFEMGAVNDKLEGTVEINIEYPNGNTRTVTINVTQVVSIYERFIGKYTLEYDNLSGVAQASVVVEIKAGEHNKTLILDKSLFDFDIEIQYLAEDGKLRISPQLLDDSVSPAIWACMLSDSDGGRWWHNTTLGIITNDVVMTDGKVVSFSFVDDGTWFGLEGFRAKGISIRNYAYTLYTGGGIQQGINMKFIKVNE